jgi:hypothetical protein
MELKGSLLRSQRPATDPYPEPDASSPLYSRVVSSLLVFRPKFPVPHNLQRSDQMDTAGITDYSHMINVTNASKFGSSG